MLKLQLRGGHDSCADTPGWVDSGGRPCNAYWGSRPANGDGCTHETFGHDPLGFKAGIGTHDWGLCDTCMHHKCESRQYGTAICLAPKGWKKPPEPQIVMGATAENTYESIRNACPAGSKPLKCNKLELENL